MKQNNGYFSWDQYESQKYILLAKRRLFNVKRVVYVAAM
jgi:hypothetical protein